ncbi:MAG TPA: hypothetical protein PK880_03150 [Candidatus Competibacter sp.]|nr:hypothetical protein [Candidatus Competibacter sp.]
MPIFVERRIIGVAVSTGGAAEARRFKASPVRLMLRDPKFRSAIGYDQREKRHGAVRAALLDDLVKSGLVRSALSEALGVSLCGGKEQAAGALAGKLLETEIGEAVQSIYKVRAGLGQHCRVEDRTVICEIMGLILPLCYDEGVIDCARTRQVLPEAIFLELPAGIATVGEVIMAGIHGRPARFKPLRDRNAFPEGLYALPESPDSGFDSDGAIRQLDSHAHLCNKLLAGDETSFDAFMIGSFVNDAAAYRARGVEESDLIGMVADELEHRAIYRQCRYYFILDLPNKGIGQSPILAAAKNLKNRYPSLDFIVLGHAGDGNIIRQERKRFGILRDIL